MDTFFETDECMLAYRLKRAGPKSIIFIHGLGASKSFFDTAFELTKFRDYTLATVDLPGCGESSWPESFSYSMRNQAGLVLKWIKGMGLDRITLAGHSMGGVIGLYVAEELGKKVTAFFNLEGNMGFEDCVFSGKIASLSPGVFEKLGLQQF
jgi:pimeloyl-ACP methyl ester carboxylesterase